MRLPPRFFYGFIGGYSGEKCSVAAAVPNLPQRLKYFRLLADYPSRMARDFEEKKGPTDDEIRDRKLALIRAEERRKLIFNVVGGTLIFFSSVTFGMLVSGDYFSGILGVFGLRGISNEEAGVYVDCSKAENKKSRYCTVSEKKSGSNFDAIRGAKNKGPAFSLSDKYGR